VEREEEAFESGLLIPTPSPIMLYGLEKEVDSGSLPHSINQSNPFQPSSSKFKSKLVITFFSLFSLILISFNPISIPFPVPISLATFSHKCSHSISNDLKHESSSTCPQGKSQVAFIYLDIDSTLR